MSFMKKISVESITGNGHIGRVYKVGLAIPKHYLLR